MTTKNTLLLNISLYSRMLVDLLTLAKTQIMFAHYNKFGFQARFVSPPKVTFGGGFGFGGGLYKIAPNITDAKSFDFQGWFQKRSKPPPKGTFEGGSKPPQK